MHRCVTCQPSIDTRYLQWLHELYQAIFTPYFFYYIINLTCVSDTILLISIFPSSRIGKFPYFFALLTEIRKFILTPFPFLIYSKNIAQHFTANESFSLFTLSFCRIMFLELNAIFPYFQLVFPLTNVTFYCHFCFTF